MESSCRFIYDIPSRVSHFFESLLSRTLIFTDDDINLKATIICAQYQPYQ